MKTTLLLVTSLLVATSWATAGEEPNLDDPKVREKIFKEAVEFRSLERRGPKGGAQVYQKGAAKPYTGWMKTIHANGKVAMLFYVRGGKEEGLVTAWHDNGKKSEETNYKDGKKIRQWTKWNRDGLKVGEAINEVGRERVLSPISGVGRPPSSKQTRLEDLVPSTLSATQADAVTAIKELGGHIKFGDSPDEMIQVQLIGKQFTDAVWPHLKDLTDLTALTLNETQVTDLGLRQLKELTKLTSLALRSNEHITDEGLAHLKNLDKLRKLSVYSPHGTISDAGMGHLKGLTNLEELSLCGTQITDAGLQNLKGLTSLETLRLENVIPTGGTAHQKLTCNGLRHLKDLAALTELTLERIEFTDENLVHLKELKSLTALTILGTNITDAGLEHFKGITNLKKLNLVYWVRGSHITHEGRPTRPITRGGVEKLKKALPDCEVNVVERRSVMGPGSPNIRIPPPPGQGTPRRGTPRPRIVPPPPGPSKPAGGKN